MNLTEDKVKLVGYTFAISLLIPPNVGLNILGLNFWFDAHTLPPGSCHILRPGDLKFDTWGLRDFRLEI